MAFTIGSSNDEPTRPPDPTGADHKGRGLGLPADGVGSLASVYTRFKGSFIDFVVLLPLSIGLFLLQRGYTHLGIDPLSGQEMLVPDSAAYHLLTLLSVAASGAYVIVLIGRRGRTVGQAAVGIVTVRAADRAIPGYAVAARRWALFGAIAATNEVLAFTASPAAPIVDRGTGLVTVLIVAWMIGDRNRQGLHDKVAGTIVIRER